MLRSTPQQLKRFFGDQADRASDIERKLAAIKRAGSGVNVFKERLNKIDERGVATSQNITDVLNAVTRAEELRDEQLAAAAALRQKLKTRSDLKENVPDNGDNLKDKQEELEAVKVFEAESRLHVKTLRSIASINAHVAPISWYEECNEKQACGVLGEPGALQEIETTVDSQDAHFDLVHQLWEKLE